VIQEGWIDLIGYMLSFKVIYLVSLASPIVAGGSEIVMDSNRLLTGTHFRMKQITALMKDFLNPR